MHTCIHAYIRMYIQNMSESSLAPIVTYYKTYAPKTKKHYVNVRCALVENDIHVKKK